MKLSLSEILRKFSVNGGLSPQLGREPACAVGMRGLRFGARLGVEFKDENFGHGVRQPKNFDWVRSSAPADPWTFVTDNLIPQHKGGIAWLVEPPAIYPGPYRWIRKHHGDYRYVLTFCQDLLALDPKFLYCPFGSTSLKDAEMGLHSQDKEELVSMIMSNKRETEGHRLRHEVKTRFADKIKLFGPGGTGLYCDKIDSCRRFAFQIVIENSKKEYYFTEKIVDCFLTGVIPIYWGAEKVLEHFDPRGIIRFDIIDELPNILQSLSMELYQSRIAAVRRNFRLAQDFRMPEDWIWDKYPFLFRRLAG